MPNHHEGGLSGRVKPTPEGYYSVTPFIIAKGAAKLLEFTRNAFNAVEITRMPNEDGTLGHAETRIGDSIIMIFDSKKDWPETPCVHPVVCG